MQFLWVLATFTVSAIAGLTNHTVDDSSTNINYYSNPQLVNPLECQGVECSGTVDILGLDFNQLNGNTVSIFASVPNPGVNGTGFQFFFTGTAVYIFIAIPPASIHYPTGVNAIPSIDGQVVPGGSFTVHATSVAQYAFCAFSATGLADVPHAFQLDTEGTAVIFDYAIWT
ncbi:hypothetical protein B0H16DRAFT_1738765 [Mycena metata]|uniref:Uncharacterized protein n=1 Tax=Mycena metata TaxID=1033252 RepID=A0AAD7HIB6_9AGAR|nr:hypothetical protein B0H16DRAFT_1738765 [Mycena metata]